MNLAAAMLQNGQAIHGDKGIVSEQKVRGLRLQLSWPGECCAQAIGCSCKQQLCLWLWRCLAGFHSTQPTDHLPRKWPA